MPYDLFINEVEEERMNGTIKQSGFEDWAMGIGCER